MFGGLAFLVGGNMAVAASGQGGALVRVNPAQSDKLVATTNARLMEMRGRSMQGWLRVGAEDLRTRRQLAKWLRVSEYSYKLLDLGLSGSQRQYILPSASAKSYDNQLERSILNCGGLG